MVSTAHVEMHRDHAVWRIENNLWRDELAIWERAVNQAIGELPLVERALRAHAEQLQRHAASIRLYEQGCAGHEHSLAEYERGETPAELVEQARAHGRETEQHQVLRKTHEDIKSRQQLVMIKWKSLLCELMPAAPKSGSVVETG